MSDTLKALQALKSFTKWSGQDTRQWDAVEWDGDEVKKLNLQGCTELQSLPSEVSVFKSIAELRLSGCGKLQSLPPEIGRLDTLTVLNLGGCKQLTSLPEEIGDLKALRELNLGGCFCLKSLPPKIGDLMTLVKLNADECSSLVTLPDELGNLRALKDLILNKCSALKELPPQIGDLDALNNLDLRDCSKLANLPSQIGRVCKLLSLRLDNCPLLTELPDEIGQLCDLGRFDLAGCGRLSLPKGVTSDDDAQTIVAAYANKLIRGHVERPVVDLYAFLSKEPCAAKPAFFKHFLTNDSNATLLGEAVKAMPELARLTDSYGRRAIDVAGQACKEAMQASLYLLARYDVDSGRLIHRSPTSVVVKAIDYDDPAKIKPAVALKALVGDRESTLARLRAELQGRAKSSEQHVLAVKAVYVHKGAFDENREECKQIKAAAGEQGLTVEVKEDLSDAIRARFFPKQQEHPSAVQDNENSVSLSRTMSLIALAGAEFKILIVMDLADSTLKSIIDHEHVAGEDFHFVRAIAADLARALDHLHSKGLIQGDFKPRNAIVTGSDWKLIDLDVSCEIGKPFGIKPPSSGYSPPEFGAVLQQVSEGNLDKRKLSMYRASVAYDLWSFGVVLFELATGVPLWITNQDDNLTDNDLKQDLVLWTQEKLEVKLHRAVRNPTDDQKTAFDLLRKLLEPTAEGRLSHFAPGCEMLSVLDHPLFQSRDLNDATLEQMRKQLTNMDGKLDQVLEKLNAHFTMLSTLLKGVDSVAPKLICFLPVDAVRQDAGTERWWRKALSPKDWLNQRVLVFFFDPIRLTLAQTNPDSEGKGQGFELTFPKEWVAKAMPYVKIGLATLKVAAIAGRLSGFPVPDIAGVVNLWIDGQLDALKGLKDEALASLSSLTADADLAHSLLDKADKYARDLVFAEVSGAQPASGKPLSDALADPKVAEPLKKSVEELDALLPDGWAKQTGMKSGLEFATAEDGTSEWVLPEDVARFKAEGKRLLGNDPKEPSKDEETAHLTARKELSLLQQQQEKQQQKKEVPADANTQTAEEEKNQRLKTEKAMLEKKMELSIENQRLETETEKLQKEMELSIENQRLETENKKLQKEMELSIKYQRLKTEHDQLQKKMEHGIEVQRLENFKCCTLQ